MNHLGKNFKCIFKTNLKILWASSPQEAKLSESLRRKKINRTVMFRQAE